MKEPKKEENEIKSLEIKNWYLQFLYAILDKPKHGQEARAKNRFLQILIPKMQENEKERIRLLGEYADKNKDDKPIMEKHMVEVRNARGEVEKDEKGEVKMREEERFKISPENMVKFQAEYVAYMNEDCVIDVLPSNRIDIGTIKEMLSADMTEWNTQDGTLYDLLMIAFENALDKK